MAFLMPAQVVVRDARGQSEDLERGGVAHLTMFDGYASFMPQEDIKLLSIKQYKASWSDALPIVRILVAERAGMLVGTTDLLRLEDGWLLIEPMHVRPGYQRQGIGSRLFRKCEETAGAFNAPGL